jgi:hypothetical protein
MRAKLRCAPHHGWPVTVIPPAPATGRPYTVEVAELESHHTADDVRSMLLLGASVGSSVGFRGNFHVKPLLSVMDAWRVRHADASMFVPPGGYGTLSRSGVHDGFVSVATMR